MIRFVFGFGLLEILAVKFVNPALLMCSLCCIIVVFCGIKLVVEIRLRCLDQGYIYVCFLVATTL